MELVPPHLARQLQRFCYKLACIIKKSRCADQHKQIFYFSRYHKRKNCHKCILDSLNAKSCGKVKRQNESISIA